MSTDFNKLSATLEQLGRPGVAMDETQRADILQAASILRQIGQLKAKLMTCHFNDGDATDQMAEDFVSLMGVEPGS